MAIAPENVRAKEPLLGFLLFLCLHTIYLAIPDPLLAEALFNNLAECAAGVIAWIEPSEIRVEGNRIFTPRVTLEIVRGCDGIGLVLIVTAAILVSPTSGLRRLQALITSTTLVFVLNQIRLVGLYLLLAHGEPWFTPVHSLLAPTALNIGVFLAYARWRSRFPSDA